MQKMKTCARGLQTVLVCLTISFLSGCFEDETPQPKQVVPAKKESPPQPSPAKPTTATLSDPVSDNWTEKGEQTLDGKTCSTWWITSNVTPETFFSALQAHVSEKWPKGGFQTDGITTARYRITVGKNAFDDEKTAETKVALANVNDAGQRIDWAATVNADDQISATSLLKAEAEEVFRLTPATSSVAPGPSQLPGGNYPLLLFPLGIPGRPGERYNPHSVPITSVFDHRMAFRFEEGKPNTPSYGVTAFTGETATDKSQMVVEMDVNDPTSGKKATQKLYEFRSTAAKYLNGYNYAGAALAYDGHPGYDFSTPIGTPVYAAAAGRVVWAGEKDLGDGAGLYVRILHEGGFITQYLHLSAPETGINVGLQVTKGQLIGKSGNTGTGTGPHLHFEVKKNCGTNGEGGISIDPYGWTGEPGKDPYKLDGDGDSYWMWETPR
ncbi:MAG: M23 family metallopeptidase [bacterium]